MAFMTGILEAKVAAVKHLIADLEGTLSTLRLRTPPCPDALFQTPQQSTEAGTIVDNVSCVPLSHTLVEEDAILTRST